jgi:hypothetical protein
MSEEREALIIASLFTLILAIIAGMIFLLYLHSYNDAVMYEDDEYYIPFLGSGSAWGDMSGKVKTRQIGFIRATKRKTPLNNQRKSNGKGRKKTGSGSQKQS